MRLIEDLMYQVSGYFLPPVLLLIILLFLYSIFALGDFITQYYQRKKNQKEYLEGIAGWQKNTKKNKATTTIKGFDLFNFASKQQSFTEDTLSVYALKNLETLRVVTRIAPMLGLVATMVPMGPALKSLANGNIQGISENLIVAFSAVIFGLLIASFTFWMAAVKKRWIANEMVDLLVIADSIQDRKKQASKK